MNSLLSAGEYYLLAAFQAAIIVLVMAAWIVWQIVWRCMYWAFEILIALLFRVCRGGTCRSTVKLLRLLPPEFGVECFEGRNDAD